MLAPLFSKCKSSFSPLANSAAFHLDAANCEAKTAQFREGLTWNIPVHSERGNAGVEQCDDYKMIFEDRISSFQCNRFGLAPYSNLATYVHYFGRFMIDKFSEGLDPVDKGRAFHCLVANSQNQKLPVETREDFKKIIEELLESGLLTEMILRRRDFVKWNPSGDRLTNVGVSQFSWCGTELLDITFTHHEDNAPKDHFRE